MLPEAASVRAAERLDKEVGSIACRARRIESTLASGCSARPLRETRALTDDTGADLRRHEHTIAGDNRRRNAYASKVRLPTEIFRCAPTHRQITLVGDA
jgi:hypothetical protein